MISNVLLGVLAVLTGGPIDQYVVRAAQRDGVKLSDPVDDHTFLRRVTLDLTGRIPTDAEREAFENSPDRSALVERLLNDRQHAVFWSRIWTSTLIGYGQTAQVDRECLRGWLEERFASDAPLDETVSQLVGAQGRAAFDGPANFMLRHARDPVVPIGRIFLGVQLDCAHCHDHPFDRWTQEDFELMGRYFTRVQARQPSPGTYEVVDRSGDNSGPRPRFLTGARPQTGAWRQELALQITRSKPFARTMVNRLWYHFFGRGIKDPPDALNGEPRSDDLELIHHLTDRLKGNGFRLRALIREICLSEAYGRTVSHDFPDWTLMPTVKPLTPDQLYDSLMIALGGKASAEQRQQFTRSATSASLDDTFGNTWDLKEQTQTLMTRLNMPIGSQNLSHREMIRRVLGREPTGRDLELCRGHSTREVMFALIHSNEFCFWH